MVSGARFCRATLNYSRVSEKGSLLLRAGILSTAFGSFLLRYDDAVNPLADVPPAYGYYYALASSLPARMGGASSDATLRGKLDNGRRAVYANSLACESAQRVCARSIWQLGRRRWLHHSLWTGTSAPPDIGGPYLDRHHAFFFPGEANPSTLPAHGVGVDAQWAHGHWNVQGEFQRFEMPYTKIPDFREDAGYLEVKRVLHPRWYVAARSGYTSGSVGGYIERNEFAVGFRPFRAELIKFDYELDHHSTGTIANDNTFVVQFITTGHLSHALR